MSLFMDINAIQHKCIRYQGKRKFSLKKAAHRKREEENVVPN